MEQNEIDLILAQIEQGRLSKDYIYHCCGKCFSSKYSFYQHLYKSHNEEYESCFKQKFHIDQVVTPVVHISRNKRKEPKKVKGFTKYHGVIKLTTRQCERLFFDNPPYPACKKCGAPTSRPYYYKDSSVGPIYVCDACNYQLKHPKGEYLRKVDGSFESNK